MPVWKVSDEETASELHARLGDHATIVVEDNSSIFNGQDAVILAPTVHPGVTMLITARRKSVAQSPTFVEPEATPVPDYVESSSVSEESPATEFLPAQESTWSETGSVADIPETVSIEPLAEAPIEPPQPQPAYEPIEEASPELVSSEVEDDFFGPTSWDRLEIEIPVEEPHSGNFTPAQQESSFELAQVAPVYHAPEPDETASFELPPVPEQTTPPPAAREKHYVATGFLGLDETVEDEEDLAREKRPWWKRLFLD